MTMVLTELAAATEELGKRHPDLFDRAPAFRRFVSPLAEGADQFGATVALELGYSLQAILPLPREDYRQDFAGAGEARFDSLLGRAESVLELPAQRSGRAESYMLAGRATLAHSDILIALWDGEPARGTGGTAEVVSLALRRGVPVIHLATQPDDPGRILWTGYGEFVDASDFESIPSCPITPTCLRELVQRVIGPPSHPQALADLKLYLAEREWRLRPRAEYPLMLAMLGVKRLRRSTFSSGRYEEGTRAEWLAFREACGSDRHGVATSIDELQRAFAWADRLAQHFGQTYRSGHVLNFTAAAFAILIALTGLLLPHSALMALAEPIVIAVFVINTLVGSSREWHRRWLEYRQLAERIRPMRSLKLLGIASPPLSGSQDHALAAGWIDWYARAQWRAAGCPSGRLVDAAKLVSAIVQEEIQPQIAYNKANAHQLHVLDHRLHRAGILLFCISILSCICSVTINLVAPQLAAAHSILFVATSAGLPAIGSAIFGIRMQGDFCSTADRSLVTADDLTRIARALLAKPISLARQTDLTEAAAATMLADLAEWRRAYEQRSLQLG